MGSALSFNASKGSADTSVSSATTTRKGSVTTQDPEVHGPDIVINDDLLISPGSRTPSSAAGLTPRPSPLPNKRSPVLPLSNPPSRKSSAVDNMKAKVLVKTGEQEKSGTDANVYIQLEDQNFRKTNRLKLDQAFYDDLERGKLDSYHLLFPEGILTIKCEYKLFM